MRFVGNTLLAAAMVLAFTAPVLAQAAKPKKTPTAAQLAARERQKACSVEWRKAKTGGTLTAGQKWPQFWSACNKRLKAERAA